ncbi:hypothetical protein [Stenotrophomonas sp.]|uniref:hypothetical protein n=1 Tax=Stenotrophomonas sp. TaxID=69392 RepID=UPI0028AADDBE|nr:hypothetical protein [Stenotrophomonas sp.]
MEADNSFKPTLLRDALIPQSGDHMRILHVLAILLFLAALCFYVASSSTGAWLLGGIGIVLEIVAWVIALTSRNPTTPGSSVN